MEQYGIRMLSRPEADYGPGPAYLRGETAVLRFYRSLPFYQPTPLVPLPELAAALGVRGVFVKDESQRFGLNAFKGLGGLYALFRVVCDTLGLDPGSVSFSDLTRSPLRERVEALRFVTATDGNHGRSVAWAAGLLGCRAQVYLPQGSSPSRVRAIREAGKAEAQVTDWSYDDTVRYAARMAREKGWILVQDTAWPGYETVPSYIMQGYTALVGEALAQLGAPGLSPTHTLLQAGVGSMAAAVLGALRSDCASAPPTVGIVESEAAACFYESALASDGTAHPAAGNGVTIMAGLNCAEASSLAWPLLRDGADAFFSCPDWVSAHGTRLLQRAGVTSGECGAVTAGLLALLAHPAFAAMKEAFGLHENAVVLLFSTEGDTDPGVYRRITEENAFPAPFPV